MVVMVLLGLIALHGQEVVVQLITRRMAQQELAAQVAVEHLGCEIPPIQQEDLQIPDQVVVVGLVENLVAELGLPVDRVL